jgi:hypothetical protein
MLTDHLLETGLHFAVPAVLTPIAVQFLNWLAPPLSQLSVDLRTLERKYGRIEGISQGACLLGMLTGFFVGNSFHKNSPWLLGLMLGWMVLFPMIWVAFATFRSANGHWSEFWVYYEVKYKVSRRVLLPAYLFLCILGVVSTVTLAAR